MGIIPEALVEETWLEVGALSESQARKQMEQIAKSQPALLAFVLAATADLPTDAQQVAVYLYAVIHRMFEKSAGRLTPATPQAVEAAFEGNKTFLGKFEHAHERFLEKAAETAASSQPFVMKYLVEALLESPEGDDPVVLSDEEIGLIFLVLKTAIDILDAGVPQVS